MIHHRWPSQGRRPICVVVVVRLLKKVNGAWATASDLLECGTGLVFLYLDLLRRLMQSGARFLS